MNNEITTIITLYKTPLSKLRNLVQYKNFNPIFFEQNGSLEKKQELKNILNFKFKYFFSEKNIGLSKSSNYLLTKVETKFCLFSQADINIDEKSIEKLKAGFNINKDIIFVAPEYLENTQNEKKLSFSKKINLACVLCDVEKLKKIGFFDEDFFLYWEDIDLMDRVNKTEYKMITIPGLSISHDVSKSSSINIKTELIRNLNFTYGDLVYQFKRKKLKNIKILRKIITNFFLFFFNILKFQLKTSIINLAVFFGVIKFLIYLMKSLYR